MPNIVTTTITLQGIGSDDRFYSVKDDKKHFDFNKIIPEPESATECVEKYGVDYIDPGDRRIDHEDGKPWFDWYSWHCEFWGTKWNAFCTEIIDDDTVQFGTAWSAPDPILGKISRMFPDKEMQVHSDYETGEVVDTVYKNGEVISSEMTEDQM
ncbi:MAG: hypothetical protein J5725_00205 [Bacteroidales bacterium]|nr:hypothetical protein [Bacteroidales bacterium]